MDTYTIKGKVLKAEVPKIRITRIIVYGFDHTLPEGDIKNALINVFSSCGEIMHLGTRIRSRHAEIIIRGGAKENALSLSGTESDVGIFIVQMVSEEDISPEAFARRDADIRRNRCVHVCVTGFDTTLPGEYIKRALAQLFSSCGEIAEVSLTPPNNRLAIVYVMGEGAKEKALELHGSDMGGLALIVFVPEHISARDEIKKRCTRIAVSGYDNSLREDVIMADLYNHFDSCGDIFDVTITSSEALVFILGEGAAEKALQLSGTDMRGCKLVVHVQALPLPVPKQDFDEEGRPITYGFSGIRPTGYGFPGARPTGYGFPGARPTGYGFPGALPTGYGFPGASPTGYGFPGARPTGHGFPGPYPQ